MPGSLDVGGDKGSDERPEVYPNPSGDDFNVDVSGPARSANVEVTVLAQSGQIVASQTVTGTQAVFRLSEPPGIYFVKVVSEGGYIAVLKLIKTH